MYQTHFLGSEYLKSALGPGHRWGSLQPFPDPLGELGLPILLREEERREDGKGGGRRGEEVVSVSEGG